mmetsp:Transcript_48335/g.126391  ORF Transcript_48335/g.126391 Transcript_48335/m.126391 type:complete len:305 (-) Transcript_48335:206-1120(-)
MTWSLSRSHSTRHRRSSTRPYFGLDVSSLLSWAVSLSCKATRYRCHGAGRTRLSRRMTCPRRRAPLLTFRQPPLRRYRLASCLHRRLCWPLLWRRQMVAWVRSLRTCVSCCRAPLRRRRSRGGRRCSRTRGPRASPVGAAARRWRAPRRRTCSNASCVESAGSRRGGSASSCALQARRTMRLTSLSPRQHHCRPRTPRTTQQCPSGRQGLAGPLLPATRRAHGVNGWQPRTSPERLRQGRKHLRRRRRAVHSSVLPATRPAVRPVTRLAARSAATMRRLAKRSNVKGFGSCMKIAVSAPIASTS